MGSLWLRQNNQSAKVMGVLNCTPDSFSDGISQINVDKLVSKAERMLNDGATFIDVGGESTRPNATPVAVEEELKRVIPVIQALSDMNIIVSVDTMKAEVMHKAVKAGATLINDVSALQFDSKSMDVAASSNVDVCLMHMKGSPQTMQNKPKYRDVVSEVISFFEQRVEACLKAGIQTSSILLDPGIGFGKRLEDNLKLISNIDKIKELGFPLVLGASRKSFLGVMTGAETTNREIETAVSSAIGIFGGADVIRVHDCKQHSKTAIVASMLADYREPKRIC